MASFLAIAGACEAVIRMLRAKYDAGAFDGPVLDFQVYVAADFEQPMDQGVSLFLYRLYPSVVGRNLPGRALSDRQRRRAQLGVDAHFLLTAWARKASLQHEIAGWMMRAIEDWAILPPAMLNAYRPDVFGLDEAVEIIPAQLSVEELFRIWEVVVDHKYQLSVPYMLRMVPIEGAPEQEGGGVVQERVGQFAVPGGA